MKPDSVRTDTLLGKHREFLGSLTPGLKEKVRQSVLQQTCWLALVVILIVSATDLWLIPRFFGDWALYLFLVIDAIVLVVVLRWILTSLCSVIDLPEKPIKR